MASEAMNIKTLNCVVMASPRRKIEQSVGRILRQRPEERSLAPLIVDIVDVHPPMNSQSRNRIQFYRKCGYKVIDGDESDDDTPAPRGSKKKEKDPFAEYAFLDD
jgi:hypothetical protein